MQKGEPQLSEREKSSVRGADPKPSDYTSFEIRGLKILSILEGQKFNMVISWLYTEL